MPKNIVLLILDTVRKDYFDKYAPRIQDLGDTSFEQCRAASSCSVPSHGSILTGELPSQHGIHSQNVDYSGIKLDDTILSKLDDYRTVGISANTYASSSFGFDEHFDKFIEITQNRKFIHGMDVENYVHESDYDGLNLYLNYLTECLQHDHTLASVGNGVVAQLNRTLSKSMLLPKLFDDGADQACSLIKEELDNEENNFIFANIMDAHWPMHHTISYDSDLHDAPKTWSSLQLDEYKKLTYNIDGITESEEEYINNYREVYAASIDYLDRLVSKLIQQVETQVEGETTFIITSDHGENLGFESDDYLFSHKASVTESLLHVPFVIVNGPEGYPATTTEYVSQLSLGEIIEDIQKNKAMDVFQETVAAELIGAAVSYKGFDEDEEEYWSRMIRCAYRDNTKIEWDSLESIYEIEIDHARPSSQTRLRELETVPKWASDHFQQDINTSKSSHTETITHKDMNESTKAQLEHLGYR